MVNPLFFWKDAWLYDKSLCPTLFKLCEQKDAYVHQVMVGDVQPTFTRWLTEELNNQWSDSWGCPTHFHQRLTEELNNEWLKILEDTNNIKLVDSEDCVGWKSGKAENFSVKSTWLSMRVANLSKTYGKASFLQKLRFFLWLIENNAILTKDNMLGRQWKGDPAFYFCPICETGTHCFIPVFNYLVGSCYWVWEMVARGQKVFMHLALQQFAGPFGKPVTRLVLVASC